MDKTNNTEKESKLKMYLSYQNINTKKFADRNQSTCKKSYTN